MKWTKKENFKRTHLKHTHTHTCSLWYEHQQKSNREYNCLNVNIFLIGKEVFEEKWSKEVKVCAFSLPIKGYQ